MNKLAIKSIISHIAIAFVAIVIFSLTITITLIGGMREEYYDYCKDTSAYLSEQISIAIKEQDLDRLGDYNISRMTSGSYSFYFKVGEKKIFLPEIFFSKNIVKSNISVRTAAGKTYWICTSPYSQKSSFDTVSAQVVVDDKVVALLEIEPYIKEVAQMDDYMRRVMYLAFLLTMLIALIVSLAFEMRLIGPMSALRKNINNIKLQGDIDWVKVKSGDEIEEINDELKQITLKMQEANRSQIEFFQNTSHDLKTPLMSISGYAEALRDGVMGKDEQKNALDIIIEESSNLSDAISSILYLSSMEGSSKYTEKETVRVNFYESVEELANKTIEVQEGKIKVINNLPMALTAIMEQDKFMRVLSNLYANALRYTKSKIEFDLQVEKNDYVFTVRDDGEGFKEDEYGKVFDRFYKGERGKNGLGLSIVKKIVSTYKGQVRAYNHPDGGAVIEIRIPDFYRFFIKKSMDKLKS